MRAINEANLSVAMKPRRSQDQIEVGAGRPDDAAERKIKLKRSRSSLQGETVVERDAGEIGEKEKDSKELETSSKRKFSGDQEKTQVLFKTACSFLAISILLLHHESFLRFAALR